MDGCFISAEIWLFRLAKLPRTTFLQHLHVKKRRTEDGGKDVRTRITLC